MSVFIADNLASDSLDDWIQALGEQQLGDEQDTPVISSDKATVKILTQDDNCKPVRPAASDPPTPQPDSAVSMTEGYPHLFTTSLPQPTVDTPLRSHPLFPVPKLQRPSSPTDRAGPVLSKLKIEIIHPSPRRLHSHPALLQRSSSDVSGLNWARMPSMTRSVSDSPGPPPPRSPLRITRDPESIGALLEKRLNRKLSLEAKVIPAVREAKDRDAGSTRSLRPQKREYDCAIPAEWERARRTQTPPEPQHPRNRFRPRPQPLHVIDAVVKSPSATANTPRRRLRRARPGEPRPLDVSKKTQSRSNLSILPDNSSSSDIASNAPRPIRAVPQPTTAPLPATITRPPRVPVKGRKSPGPRPRSAKMVPCSLKSLHTPPELRSSSPHKSHQHHRTATVPALPSPPPTKSLPPTPKESSRRTSHARDASYVGPTTHAHSATVGDASMGVLSVSSVGARSPIEAIANKALPTPPYRDSIESVLFPSPPSSAAATATAAPSAKHIAAMHVRAASEASSTGGSGNGKGKGKTARLEARLEALERHNRLLEAALVAVLKTGGTLNGCPCHGDGDGEHVAAGGVGTGMGMGTEKVGGVGVGVGGEGSRGSVTSRASTASCGLGALEMYLSTRGKRGL